MLLKLERFLHGEDGAVTVDWVVLTAGIVGLGAVVILSVSNAATNQADSVGTVVGNLTVGYENISSSD